MNSTLIDYQSTNLYSLGYPLYYQVQALSLLLPVCQGGYIRRLNIFQILQISIDVIFIMKLKVNYCVRIHTKDSIDVCSIPLKPIINTLLAVDKLPT